MSKTAEYNNRWRETPNYLIVEEIRQQEKKIYEFKRSYLSKPVTDVKAIYNARKNIARLRTILREKQLILEIPNGHARLIATERINSKEAVETGMSTYKFACNFKSNALKDADLPVEVRNPNAGLVKRGVSSQFFRLHQGEYYISTIFPAGQEAFCHLNTKGSKHETVTLESDPNNFSANASEELQRLFVVCSTPLIALPSDRDNMGINLDVTEARLRLWAVNFFRQQATDITSSLPWPKAITKGRLNTFRVVGRETTVIAQLLTPNAPVLNTVLPAWRNIECFFTVCKQSDSSLSVEPHVLSVEADALLRYEQYHYFEEAAAMLTSNMLIFPRFLDGQKKDVVSAVVLAYAILRYGDINRLERWADRLSDDSSQFPDGTVIYGEYLARMGKHERALEAFVSLIKRGLPLFSIGLTHVIERLSMYVLPDRYALKPERVQQARALLGRLSELAEYVDFSKPYLTFNGINPLQPSREPISGETIKEGIGLGPEQS